MEYTITLTREEFRELLSNYQYRQDESYNIHTAYLIYQKIFEQHPGELTDIDGSEVVNDPDPSYKK